MSESTASVRSQPPPRALIKVFNVILPRVLGNPMWRMFPGWMGVLRFDGAKTGKHYVVSVGIYDVDGEPVVLADGAWRANFRGGIPVSVTTRGKTLTGKGTLVEDPEVVGRAMQQLLTRLKPRQIGVVVAKGHTPTPTELGSLRRMIVLDVH
jgi:hypothetical protein